MDGSKPFLVNSQDVERILKGAMIAVAGALAVYIADIVPTIDFGIWTPLAVALASVAVNALRIWVADNTVK